MLRSHARSLGLLLSLPVLGLAWAGQPPTEAKPTPFTTQVIANFNTWDADGDGVLEPAELDTLVVDTHLTGAPAAAAGALKGAQRNAKIQLPPVTLDMLHAYERAVAAKEKPAFNFDRPYTRALRRISSPKRDLLNGEVPTLESCHQGPLGDCYFVAVVGAAVVRDADSVRRMINPCGEGSFSVVFGNGKEVKVEPLTDAELALTSSAGAGGLWLSILEKAYGSIRTESLPEDKQSESATDAIAHGGSSVSTIRLLTGHTTDRIGFRPRTPRPTTGAPATKPGSAVPAAPVSLDPALIEKHLAEALPKVRTHLVESLGDRRLVAAGTPKDGKMPPGVNGNHAYAVLGYDPDHDTVDLWNPHGNTFRPKGTPGLENGYPTAGGRFTMPLEELGRVFNGIVFETGTPLPAK